MSKYHPISNSSVGVLLGTAVGDSLGLSAERLTPERISKNGWNQWRQRFFFGKGMVSDDTEHALFAPGTVLAWCQPERDGEVPASAEGNRPIEHVVDRAMGT